MREIKEEENETIQTLKDLRFLLENSTNKEEIIATKLDVIVTELNQMEDTIAFGVIKGGIALVVISFIIAILLYAFLGIPGI